MSTFVSPDLIRAQFSRAMSDMYRAEVPLYGNLIDLVGQVNADTLSADDALAQQLARTGEIDRLDAERHGAIRVGTADELATIRRLFSVMGMVAVGYYDLSSAGVPVHSTAFRATHEDSLRVSPFRVFTSLLRLELIGDAELRAVAADTLARRDIFTPRVRELIAQHESAGGLTQAEADEFVQNALETFRWHHTATVSPELYKRLHDENRLLADVVAFKGPHINHLTPRTLDIDAAQIAMPLAGIAAKAVIEGPPPRSCPILLRQTSFKALEEAVNFTAADGTTYAGSHTARFGEIEQRGVALTPKGRALYDRLLNDARATQKGPTTDANAQAYMANLSAHFAAFPDDHATLRAQGIGYYRYFTTGMAAPAAVDSGSVTLDALIEAGCVAFEPLVYEDFLPVSAAGIFQSNLGENGQSDYSTTANQTGFQAALGGAVLDELALYAETQRRSIEACAAALGVTIASENITAEATA